MRSRRFLIIGMAIALNVGMLISSGYARIEQESIIGLWLMNENEDNIAVDSSENGNDGELKNGAIWNEEGMFGDALELNGAGAHVEFGVNENLKPEQFTLVSWFNTRKLNSYGHIFQSGKDWDDIAGIIVRVHQDGSFQTAMATGAGNTASWINGPALSDETWYHIAITSDGALFTLYMNGEKTGSTAGGEMLYDDRTVRIGVHPDDLGAAFDGFIDEVALFNAALTQEDVQAIMNEGLEEATGLLAVSSEGKLATTWGNIRM